MIELNGITKKYGSKFAVKNVSFSADQGQILGFLGRNGAGKSTTMNIITGYISASSGSVCLDGLDILRNPRDFKRKIGYLPEIPPLYPDMTVEEYLRFVCAIKELKRESIPKHLNDICELTAIEEVRKRLIRNLSKGYKQRVGLAMALIGNPDLIILDEPTAGLDPMQILEIRDLIRELRNNHTVILSSHILKEVADVCDQIVIINRGVIVAQDSLANLSCSVSERSGMILRIAGESAETIRGSLSPIPGLISVECQGEKEAGSLDYIINYRKADDLPDIRLEVQKELRKTNGAILMLKPDETSLEDVFLRLTADTEHEDAEVVS